ncbi:unnamed protein product [Gongylonema pulchrum]|uniref:Helicase C-terminal domain-containing protein n=1 Tax=Gongylonema pulchrum TaxID=637853 RepID=A0A183EHN4_9BILA|nr:unnamed protein product [Gongylonema pulchrum]
MLLFINLLVFIVLTAYVRYWLTDGARLIFSSATCPDELQRATESIVDEEHLYCIRTDNLHCLMPHVKHTFIRIREMDKLEKLKELLQKGLNFASGQTLIFCKDLSNVKLVSTALRENGIEHAVCGGGRQIRHLIEELRDGKIRIIVATDVASRGLDLAHLRHIVNYDFPRQISDYVHRCGRIGRVGSIHKSLVTSFVRRAWEVKHVNTIEVGHLCAFLRLLLLGLCTCSSFTSAVFQIVVKMGLDLAHLRHIVNYDFPRQISDYVHRCGRIGRVGSIHKSLVTSFVRRAWEVKHVNTIELAARLGRPLEDVEMNNSARLRGMQKILVQ